MNRKIFIIGSRASGKTTLGQGLGEKLNKKSVDTDVYLRESTGLTTEEIVAKEGWPGFRKRESDVLREVTESFSVISTGGGMILAPENREFMRASGTVFFLDAPVEVLVARLQADPDHALRPSLTGKPIYDEVADILKERMHIYRETAHHVVDASKSKDEVVELVLELFRK